MMEDLFSRQPLELFRLDTLLDLGIAFFFVLQSNDYNYHSD